MAETGKTAFVLGGGGRWGAVEVGMLRALSETGVRPDVIVGTSIGAFNGAVYAAEPSTTGLRRLEQLWSEVAETGLLKGSNVDRFRKAATLQPALHGVEEIQTVLDHALPVRTFGELVIPFQCVAASIEAAAEHWFTDGDLVPALMASAAIPGLFPPIAIDGAHYYDGGLVNSIPLDRAIELGASTIFVLQVGRIEQPLEPPKRIFDAALIAFEIARRHRFATMRERLPDGVDVHVLPTGKPLSYDDPRQLRWNDLGDTADLVETAYQASRRYLTELEPA